MSFSKSKFIVKKCPTQYPCDSQKELELEENVEKTINKYKKFILEEFSLIQNKMQNYETRQNPCNHYNNIDENQLNENADKCIKQFSEYNLSILKSLKKQLERIKNKNLNYDREIKNKSTIEMKELDLDRKAHKSIEHYQNYIIYGSDENLCNMQLLNDYSNSIGPGWYQELSDRQMNIADDLYHDLLNDLKQNTVFRCKTFLNKIGINPIINSKNIQRILELSCGNDLAFLWFLFDIFYKSSSNNNETDVKKEYSLNERLILSTICHLDMITTLRELDRIIPKPLKKKIIKMPKQKRTCFCNYFSPYLEPIPRPKMPLSKQLSPPIIPNPKFIPYEIYKDENYIVLNETNRWYSLATTTSVDNNIIPINLMNSNLIDEGRPPQTVHDFENELFINSNNEGNDGGTGGINKDKKRLNFFQKFSCFKTGINNGVPFTACCTFNKNPNESNETDYYNNNNNEMNSKHNNDIIKNLCIELLTDENKNVKQLLNGILKENTKCYVDECSNNNNNNNDDNCGCDGGSGGREINSSSINENKNKKIIYLYQLVNENNNEVFQILLKEYIIQIIVKIIIKDLVKNSINIKSIKMCRCGSECYDEYNFYKEIINRNDQSPSYQHHSFASSSYEQIIYNELMKNKINLAVELDQQATEDNEIIYVCMKNIWQLEIKMWTDYIEQLRINRITTTTAKETQINELTNLLIIGLNKMRTNPKFVLSTLPDIHKLPLLVEWIKLRFNKKYTITDRIKLVTKTKKLWTLNVGNFNLDTKIIPKARDICKMEMLNYDYNYCIMNRIKELNETYKRKLKLQLINQCRLFWPTMKPYLCRMGPPRKTFYAYLPAKENEIFTFRPWQLHECKKIKK